jgi:PBSX family phage terminase large subunit
MILQKSTHAIIRKNFNSVKRSIIMDTLPKVLKLCFPNLEYSINRTDWFLTIPNGSRLMFFGLDNPKNSEKILGLEFSTLYFNETSEIDYSSVQIAITRLAEKNRLNKRIYMDMNPSSKAHWTYDLFIRKLNPVDNETLNNPDQYASLIMNPTDNLENLDKEYVDLLNNMPEQERERFLLGLFADDSDGQAYYAFRRDDHVQEFEKFRTPIMFGMDFNVSPSTAIIFQFVNNTFFILDEVYLQVGDTYKVADELNRRGYRGGDIYPDSTGKNRKTSGKSDFDILKESGFRIKTVHNPLQRDRVNNVNRLFSHDRIIVHKRCKKLINDLEKTKWKNGKLDEGKDKLLTHVSDCLGYPTWQLAPINAIIKKVSASKYR